MFQVLDVLDLIEAEVKTRQVHQILKTFDMGNDIIV